MNITREQIRNLAQFQEKDCCALSFYLQPSTPRNKAHKEDTILIKDLAREALHSLESKRIVRKSQESKGGRDHVRRDHVCREQVRADLDRVVRLSAELRSNGTHAKAIFACAARNMWLEYDVPVNLPGTQLFLDRHFHLKPIAHLLGACDRLGVVLVDRHRARFFDFRLGDLRLGELNEREVLFQPLSRKGRSDGYAGYDGGRAQRRIDDEARHHFKIVAEMLKESLEKGVFDKWILGCQDLHRSQLEPQLHPYVSQALLGRFNADMAHIANDEIRGHAQQILEQWQNNRRRELVDQAVSQARSHGRGVTGLRRVLRSLESGEVQTLLIGEHFQAHAVECTGCGHIDAHLVAFCPVCGRAAEEIVDVGEALFRMAIRRDIEMLYVHDDPEFDKVGNIAALLRFRPDRVQPIDAAIADQLGKAGASYPGRLRRFAGR
jgi:peptide chain release factor subunit 1